MRMRTRHRWEELWTFGGLRRRRKELLGITPNDRSHTRTGQEAALRSISSAFVVTELLMTYKEGVGGGGGRGCARRPPGQHVRGASNYSLETADSFLHLETRFAGAN